LAALRPAAPRFFFFLELRPIGQAGRSASGRVAAGVALPRRKQTAAEAEGDVAIDANDGCDVKPGDLRWRVASGGRRRGFAGVGLGWPDGRGGGASTRVQHDCPVGPGAAAGDGGEQARFFGGVLWRLRMST